MLFILKIYLNLSKMFIHLLSLIQILLMILVFLTAMYWFLELINVHFLSFAEPIIDYIKSTIKVFYNREIELGGVVVDGSLLLLDLTGIFLALLINQIKSYLNSHIGDIKHIITAVKNRNEARFNKYLEENLKKILSEYNKVAILLNFEVSSMMKYSNKFIDLDAKVEQAYKTFNTSCGVLKHCKIKKMEDKTLILLDDVLFLDNILAHIYHSLEIIRNDYRKNKVLLKTHIAVNIYDTDERLQNETLPYLERLLILHHLDQAVCLGNLKLKYEFDNIQSFFVFKKGVYDIIGESEVYMIVKKD